jgi:predicted kinase
MAEAVILVGLQGSGKTTYYRTNLLDTHVLVSGDVQGSPQRQAAVVRESLASGRSFTVDNTNLTRAARAAYIRPAKEAGYRVVCCYLDTPVRTAIGRNNHRKDKKAIPVPAILRSAKNLQLPAMDEGFDEILVIQPDSRSTT